MRMRCEKQCITRRLKKILMSRDGTVAVGLDISCSSEFLIPCRPSMFQTEKLNKDGNWACPFCKFDPYHDNMKGMNYCPNCGARMKGENDDKKRS